MKNASFMPYNSFMPNSNKQLIINSLFNMSLLTTLLIVIGILILLTAKFKISPFISLLLVAILAGVLLGMPLQAIVKSVQKGIGEMLGSILIILSAGAMLGKLVAESGAATVIADKIMAFCGEKYLQWGLILTGLLIGIPLFYNVGFVLVIPIIFSLVYQYKLPAVYIAIPMLASLSVAHSLLPPHPSPASLVANFHADMAKTFIYGIIVAIPAVIAAGIFAKTLKHISTEGDLIVMPEKEINPLMPNLLNSIFSAMLPVFLLVGTLILSIFFENQPILKNFIAFLNEPSILMLIALLIATYTLGIRQGKKMQRVMSIYEEGIKDIAGILLTIGASGALKQILIDSKMSESIIPYFQSLAIHPLVLGWLIAAIIRILLGSATVAGLTAAGILAPMLSKMHVNPNLMVLAIGAGSIFFSHLNDTGFWMFKSYFKVSIKDTFLSWSLMESIVSVMGLLGTLCLNYIC
jgi:Gnt-I system high-affinity gluconate transporter